MSNGRPGIKIEMSVGVFVAAAAVFLAIMVFMTGGFAMRGEAMTLQVGFNDISGLKPRAPVYVAGTQLGTVKAVSFHEPRLIDGGETYCVTVTVYLPRTVRIPRGTRAFISSQGFIGEIFVGLDPGLGPEMLAEGALIRGSEMTSFADVQQTADETLRAARDMFKGMEGISKLASDEKVHDDIRMTVSNARQVSEELKGLIKENRALVTRSLERIDRLSAIAETNVTATTENLRAFSVDLRTTSGEVRDNLRTLSDRMTFIADVGGETLLETLENVRVTTAAARQGAERISSDLTAAAETVKRVTGGSETAAIAIVSNLRATSDDLRLTAEILKGLATSVDSGQGLAGAIFRDDKVESDFRAILANTAAAAKKLEELIEEIKKNPGSFFKFSLL